MEYPFTSLAEAVTSSVKPITVHSFLGEDILRGSILESDLGKLWVKLEEDPHSTVSTLDEAYELVGTGKYFFISSVVNIKAKLAADYIDTGMCQFTIVPFQFIPTMAAFAVPQKSPYISVLNEGLLYLDQTGLLNKYFGEEVNINADVCHVQKSVLIGVSGLTVHQLSAAFFLLLAGIGTSVVIALAEKCFGKNSVGQSAHI